MLIGIPKELKDHEYRVGATPAMVLSLVNAGHEVLIQKNAGKAIGFFDEQYTRHGARIVDSIEEVYNAEMIIKVKEPQKEEFSLMKREQIIFSYLHLAPDPEQAKALIKKEVVAIAYETVTDRYGHLPLLVPMSEIAGRISIQAGATCLQMANGGRGVLLGGVAGVRPGRVLVLGGGVVGTQALRIALGLGADVTVMDVNINRLRHLEEIFSPALKTRYSMEAFIEEEISTADLVIGAVLIPGKKSPKLISKAMLKNMMPGSVIVDVAVDQGGCIETTRPTTHSNPTYVEEGVVHYCVSNMPGACARTATLALAHATMPYALEIANKGYKKALRENVGLRDGLNICLGKVTYAPVADDLGYVYTMPEELIG
jgi:alanine dehydrogenase